MANSVLSEVAQLVRLLDATQSEMLALLTQKGEALRRADAPKLLEIARPEEELTERMRVLLGQRARILRRAKDSGRPAETLLDLVDAADDPRTGPLREQIERIRRTSAEIQRENRIQWVVARTGLHSCEGILELIARRGQKAPVYGKGSGRPAGALIDASV